MTTIEELQQQQERERQEEAVRQHQHIEEKRLQDQDVAVSYLATLGLSCTRSDTDTTVEAEGYTVWMTETYFGGEFPRSVAHIYVSKGRSVPVHRATSYYDFRSSLLSAMAEADELDRLDNRPYVDGLLADIRAGRWEDNYALTDDTFGPWKDELTAAWDAWLADYKRKQVEANKPQPTIDELLTRIAALEARTAETGLMGRVIRRVEALEDKSNYGSTVVNHEARLKALEAVREPAPAQIAEADRVDADRAALDILVEIAERGHEYEARRAAEAYCLLTGNAPTSQGTGPFPLRGDPS